MTAGRRSPAAALGQTAAQALQANATLAQLLAGHRQSQAWFETVRPLLGPLASQVRPGPIDEYSWTLLASHGSAGAKLRQALPGLLERLREQGASVQDIKVKVAPPQG